MAIRQLSGIFEPQTEAKTVTGQNLAWCSFAANPNSTTMNFSFDFYQRMKHDLSEKAYLKAFEMAKYMEMHPRSEWADIVHRGCSHREWAEGCGAAVEHWFNSNLLWQ